MRRLWRRWTRVRSAAAEFGPPPAARYPELSTYSDLELVARTRADILAEVRARRAARRRQREEVRN